MIKTILFAADMGMHTSYLLHHVNSLASRYQARIVVLHVVDSASSWVAAVCDTHASVEQHLESRGVMTQEVKSRLIDLLEDEFIDGHAGLSKIRGVQVVVGEPVDWIIRKARACSADMIVMGSHGQGVGPDGLGSVASKVLQLSRVPVYMVPLTRHVMSGMPAEKNIISIKYYS